MKTKAKRGLTFLLLGFTAFGGLGLEILFAFLLEPLFYGCEMKDWVTWQIILHWIITCIAWLLVAWYIIRAAKKEGFDIQGDHKKITRKRWLMTIVCMCFVLACNWLDWGGIKVICEYRNLGFLKFSFQYLYYAAETIMFLLIIVMAQKALEIWTGRENIPWGGLLCAMTWGLGHWGTKQSLLVGLVTAAAGFCFGVVYLLLHRNLKLSYLVLFIMFAF